MQIVSLWERQHLQETVGTGLHYIGWRSFDYWGNERRETRTWQFRRKTSVPNSLKGLRNAERDQVCFSVVVMWSRPGMWDGASRSLVKWRDCKPYRRSLSSPSHPRDEHRWSEVKVSNTFEIADFREIEWQLLRSLEWPHLGIGKTTAFPSDWEGRKLEGNRRDDVRGAIQGRILRTMGRVPFGPEFVNVQRTQWLVDLPSINTR